jgi:raffinose/stachyose/melibiose transport system permease protein
MDWKKIKANKYYRHSELAYISLYLPALIMFLVFVVSPLLQAIYISLTDWNGLSAGFNFIGFKNYLTFLKDDYVHHSINATIKYTLTVTIFQNFLALVLALALNNAFYGRNVLRAVFFIPSLMSNLIIGFIWSFLFSDPLMKFGKAIGWELLAKNILSSKDFAIFAAAFVTIWRSSGWTMMIYLAGLQNIPKELEEAAAIDGAVYLQRLRHIILPLIAPSFTINFILVFERCLKDFDSIFALTQGGPGNATLVMAINIYRESFFYSRGSYGTTIGVVMFAMIVFLTLLQLKFFQKGEQNVD